MINSICSSLSSLEAPRVVCTVLAMNSFQSRSLIGLYVVQVFCVCVRVSLVYFHLVFHPSPVWMCGLATNTSVSPFLTFYLMYSCALTKKFSGTHILYTCLRKPKSLQAHTGNHMTSGSQNRHYQDSRRTHGKLRDNWDKLRQIW